MFSSLVLAALVAPLALVRADPTPTAPGPNATFNEGAPCSISWNPDTSGVWTVMNIELMSGDNINMLYLTTVATVDGTDASNTTFSYPCPAVTPNAPIYFYQFTSPFSKQLYWTTRFTIADSIGNAVPAPNATQPGSGQAIPWGAGVLQNPSQANAEPTFGQSAAPSSTGSAVLGASPSSSPGVVPSSGAPGSSQGGSSSSPSVPSSSNHNSAVAGSATNTSSAGGPSASGPANGARAGVTIDSRLFKAAVALGVAATTFAIAL